MIAATQIDRIYRWQRHVYDWTRPLLLPGRDRMLAGIMAPDGAAVLEIGCGTARNLIRLARRNPTWRLHGLDLSPSMLRTARARIPNSLRDRIRLAEGDALDWTPRRLFGTDLEFHAVLFSYSLSMIPEPRRALDRAAAAVAPGGSLHVVDFAGPGEMRAPWSWFLPAWLRLWGVRPAAGLQALVEEALAGSAGSPSGGWPPPGLPDASAEPGVQSSSLRRGYAVLAQGRRSGVAAAGSVPRAGNGRTTGGVDASVLRPDHRPAGGTGAGR